MIPLYPPSSLVGAWITTHEFLRYLVTLGHRVDVTAYRSVGPTVTHEGVAVETHFRNTDRADVVIGHAGDDGSAADIAKRLGCPLVLMVHGGNAELVRTKLDDCQLAVFNSDAFAHEVSWDGPQVVCVPPVDPSAYRTSPGSHVTLVNLTEDKGAGLFWSLTEALPDIPFLGCRGGYGQQVMYSGHPNVTLQRPTEQMRDQVYARTRVLLMPSRWETYGRVAVEAAASGIPTIAHPTPGIVEAMGNSATYVDRDDLVGWIEAIEHLQDPDHWLAASKAARARRRSPARSLSRFAQSLTEVAACVS